MKKKIKYVLIFPILCLVLLFVSCKEKEKDDFTIGLETVLHMANLGIELKERTTHFKITSASCRYIIAYFDEKFEETEDCQRIYYSLECKYTLKNSDEVKTRLVNCVYELSTQHFYFNDMFDSYWEWLGNDANVPKSTIGTVNLT